MKKWYVLSGVVLIVAISGLPCYEVIYRNGAMSIHAISLSKGIFSYLPRGPGDGSSSDFSGLIWSTHNNKFLGMTFASSIEISQKDGRNYIPDHSYVMGCGEITFKTGGASLVELPIPTPPKNNILCDVEAIIVN